jgi:hypothetical protein
VLGCRVGRHVYSWPPHHTVPGWAAAERSRQCKRQAASGKQDQAAKQPSGKRRRPGTAPPGPNDLQQLPGGSG